MTNEDVEKNDEFIPDNRYRITCPYCFKEFSHDEVHFRMETVFQNETELDREGRSLFELENMDDSSEKKSRIAAYRLKENFLQREDEEYNNFWDVFGGTTEIRSKAIDSSDVAPYHRAVFNPHNKQHGRFFKGELERDSNDLIIAATDCFGVRTRRRVCPYCHNPLPGNYGKSPIKFISVIGITGAGKTVYLSQLISKIQNYAALATLGANYLTQNERAFVQQNLVKMGVRLPIGTAPGSLPQPLFYNLAQDKGNNKIRTDTFVVYDIAGENCVNEERMLKFGRFIEHSHGIILLIDPRQFEQWQSSEDDSSIGEPAIVLNTIYNTIAGSDASTKSDRPIAVTISKGDQIADMIIGDVLDSVIPVQDQSGKNQPLFNATDYNPLEKKLSTFIQENDRALQVLLESNYSNFNYFIFSSLGTSTSKIKIDEEMFDTPSGPPNPKRIEEPLLWMFNRFGYIDSDIPIHSPVAPPPAPEKPKGFFGRLFGKK